MISLNKFVFLKESYIFLISSKSFSSIFNDDVHFYSAEHRQMQESLKKIIEKEINPFVNQWEAEKIFPAKQVFQQLGKAGFLGVDKPTKYGGLGLDYTYTAAIAEQLGAIRCGGIPMAIGVQSNMTTTILMRFGSEKLKKEFLAPTIAGDLVACLGISEISAGSDVANIKTTAFSDGEDLIINGGKMWITNGTQADWMCLLANTENDKDLQHNKSLIALPMNLPGIHVSKKIDKMGMFSSDTAQIFFENVRIPKSHIIGEQRKGFIYQMIQFQEERIFGVAVSLLPLETVIKETIEYTSQRKVFGKPLIANQVISFTIAELLTEVECLRSLLHRMVYSYAIEKKDVSNLASMAKLKVGRLSREVTDKCLQFWGGMGYTTDSYVNRVYRDMRLLSIGAGADEVMLGIIVKNMMRALK